MSKVISFTPKEGLKTSHKKDKGLTYSWVLLDCKTKQELVTVRAYWPSAVCYACVWIWGHWVKSKYATGSGSASGYGYDKKEQAVKHAFIEAGVELFESYNEQQPRDILVALAEFWGIEDYHVFEAHA